MGARQSSTAEVPAGVGSGQSGRTSSSNADNLHLPQGHHHHHHHHHHSHHQAGTSSQAQARHRVISAGGLMASGGPALNRGFPVSIPASNGGAAAAGGVLVSPGSDDSTPEDDPISRAILGSSIPVHLFSFRDIKCPVCSKLVPPDDVECHFVMCLTRPSINYNEDVLLEDKDECVICFEELVKGDKIARLPCLCIYHKSCIDQWFKVKRSCPEHPND